MFNLLFDLDILKKQEEFRKETLSWLCIYHRLDKKSSILVMDSPMPDKLLLLLLTLMSG